jgi:hypothetical protein
MVVNGTIAPHNGSAIHLEVQHENGTRYLFSILDISNSDILGARWGTLAITWWRWRSLRSGATGMFASAPTEDYVRAQFALHPNEESADAKAVTEIIRSIFGERTGQ